jgi:5-methylcytosine-specific restriction endonuclease McrA
MDCLVLSQGFAPVAKVPWTKAVALLFKERVEVVEEHDKFIHSVTLTMKMPSVIRLLTDRPRKKAVKFSRENIWARDGGHCQYCGALQTRSSMTYDHVIPKTQGGKTTWDNIVCCCMPCNQKKSGRTPAQAGMRLRREPVRPKKLPDTARFAFTWQSGMPVSWKQWMLDTHYWNGALEES